MANQDPALGPILDELRENFSHALSVDTTRLRQRLERSEAENQALRRDLDELRRTVGLLRQIASEHEARLAACESRPDPAGPPTTA